MIGAVAAAVVVAAGIGFAVMKGMGPGGDSARKVELDAARLDGEARSLLKLFDNDRRDLKEATAQSGKDIERLEGQVRAARTPQEKAPLEAALREARDKANAGAELEKKFRDRTEGPEGLPKAEGNLNAAAVAVKGKDGAEGLRMLGETVASLTALRAAIGEDRKAMQANLQRLSEQRKVEEPQPAPKVEMRAEPKAVPRPTPAQAASRDEAAAKAREAADAKAKAQADSKAAAQAEAKSKAESATRDKADAAAKAKSDAETRANARAAPKVDTKAKAEADASAKADADAKVKTEAEAKAKADAQAAEKAAKDAKLEQYKRLFQQQR